MQCFILSLITVKCTDTEVTSSVVPMSFQFREGNETGQSESSLVISHTISIPFGMAFWDWLEYTQYSSLYRLHDFSSILYMNNRFTSSHNIDCALGPLCYIRPCSIWIAWQRSSPMKGELRWRGPNSISNFDHHNINGGAADDTWRHR
jgi:hypothetical protein